MSKAILTPSLTYHPSGWESQSSATIQGQRESREEYTTDVSLNPAPPGPTPSQTQPCFAPEKAQHGAFINARSPTIRSVPGRADASHPHRVHLTQRENRQF